MSKIKRFISVLLMMLMVSSIFTVAVSVSAKETVVKSGKFQSCKNINWTLYDNGVLKIDGKGNFNGFANDDLDSIANKVEKVEISGKISSFSPEGLFFNLGNVKEVVVGNGVKEIGYDSFGSCKAKTIKLSNSITKIKQFAFSYCKNLTSLTIPSSVTDIADSAFYNCSKLQSVNLSNSIKSINGSTFENCTSLKSVVIPNSVTNVGRDAFRGCKSLTKVVVGKNVSKIVGNPFYNCSKLNNFSVKSGSKKFAVSNGILFSKDKKKLVVYPAGKKNSSYTVPKTVTEIGESAFATNRSIAKVKIPTSVAKIGVKALNYTKLYYAKNNWKNNILYVSDCVVASKSVAKVNVKSGTRLIADRAFYNNKTVKNVTLPKSLKYIGTKAFYGCEKIKTINLPKSLKKIGSKAVGYYKSGIGYEDQYGNYVSVDTDTLYEMISDDLVVTVYKNSVGHKYAKSNILNYTVKK